MLLLRRDAQSSVMVKIMLGYNIFCTILLAYAALVNRIYGQGLWPVVLLHLAMFIWCFIIFAEERNKKQVKYSSENNQKKAKEKKSGGK
jgi:4-hydroxybenzoate polyprenyltransferase